MGDYSLARNFKFWNMKKNNNIYTRNENLRFLLPEKIFKYSFNFILTFLQHPLVPVRYILKF